MHTPARQSYRHTQRAPLFALLGLVAAGILLLAWLVRREPVALLICFLTAALIVLFAQMFRYLTIEDEGHYLSLRYGPLPVFRKAIHYADISQVEAGRTSVIDGWGIHWVPGRGWTYNLWGRDCAKLTVRGRTIRIGSDDVPRLVELLNNKIKPVILTSS